MFAMFSGQHFLHPMPDGSSGIKQHIYNLAVLSYLYPKYLLDTSMDYKHAMFFTCT